MYKLVKNIFGGKPHAVMRLKDSATIPFVSDNTDYQQFKKDFMASGELQDIDGAVMSADAAKAFVGTLP